MTARALYYSTSSDRPLKVGTQLPRPTPVPTPKPAEPTPEPSAPDAAQDLHLLRRASYGPTQAGITEIATLGRTAWLERQLNPANLPDPDGDAVTALYPRLTYSPKQARAKLTAFSGGLLNDMLGHTIGRSIWSSRQLHELMVAFWNDHLHIAGAFYDAWDSRHRYDLDVIRPHALGSFAAMLQAAIRHPAMLRYLDQSNSRANRLNENLGRELLELHTIGDYAETDVIASARMLTGLSINASGEYLYRPEYHYVGALTIAGWSHPNGSQNGEAAVTAYLDHLARQPGTAKRIARKLVVRFVADDPPAALVDRLASVYLANDTNIAPVLRALFTSTEFTGSVGGKVRTPQEDIYALIRSLGFARPSASKELIELYWQLVNTGHGPMNWLPPNGFPDSAAHWATPATALARLGMHLDISAGWWPVFSGYPKVAGTRSLAGLVPTPLPATYGALVQAMAQKLLFGQVSKPVLDAICGFFGKSSGDALKANHSILTWQLSYLVALLFDSPAHSVR